MTVTCSLPERYLSVTRPLHPQSSLAGAESLARSRAAKAAEMGRERDGLSSDMARMKVDYDRQLVALREEKREAEERLLAAKKRMDREMSGVISERQESPITFISLH